MPVLITQALLRYRLIVIVMLHAVFAAGALALSLYYVKLFTYSLPVNIAIFLGISGFINLYQGIWRYVSVDDLKDIVKASALSSLIFMFVIVFSGKFTGYPRSIYLMNFVFLVILNGGTRFAIRMFRESFAPMSDNARNILIVGAGNAGNEVVKTLKSGRNRQYIPVGFIDRDKSMHGKRLQGIKVLGDLMALRYWVRKLRVHEIFIAIPEATNKIVKEVMEECRIPEWEVKFKIVPSMMDIMSGRHTLSKIRDVSIEDLLSRPNITLDDTHVRRQLAARTVLITGAGGSIGSELCFQVAAYRPARMVLIDASEQGAYSIDQELKSQHQDVPIHTIVGSILDNGFMDPLFRRFKPDFILHAAAYKHVHLMEWNPIACLSNNVLGTAHIASMAEKHGVGQFVMISTDKAVNPRGMMGISKRLAERVVLERSPSKTLFNVVRFGNVLGSSGSVIPLFQRQIREGGPVTVTSEETRRYFMSIPEAVQLVLQASTLNESNAIFMLEMGEAIKIADLARNLIELSGLKVGEDIEINYTGMRPGEKVEEILLSDVENLVKTRFEKIRVQKNSRMDPESIDRFIHNLKSDVELGNIRSIYDQIRELIPEMTGPSFEELSGNMFS
jgi:FlaA1/EpsC-like NDP-sugar epimerase